MDGTRKVKKVDFDAHETSILMLISLYYYFSPAVWNAWW